MENTPGISYPDALDHWDRSKAFGDPRDFQTFARDMEELHPGTGFGAAGARDGWWTRLSTRLDQNVFNPVAAETTEPLGAAVGGLFGQEEAGARVGRGLPRALLETAPLYLAGPEAGVPATIAALAGTGGLMAAHTYAETGSPKASLISGATGAVLPLVGRLGGAAATRLLSTGEKVVGETAPEILGGASRPVSAFLPKALKDVTGFKAAQFGGSQAAMIGLNQASMYAEDKTLGKKYDPLSPDFWLQQIPFTVYDAVHATTGRIPTAGEVKANLVTPSKKTITYTPPEVSQPEAEATIAATLHMMEAAYSDPNSTPEQREATLAAANALIQNPRGTTAAAKFAKPPEVPTEVTGHAVPLSNGNFKVLQLDPEGNDKTVFVNGVKPTANADGTVTFQATKSQVKESVTSPLKRSDFGLADVGQAELPQQTKPWPGFRPDEQRTLEEHGVPEPTAEMPEDVRAELRQHAEALDEATHAVVQARAKVAAVPQTAEEIPNLIEFPQRQLATSIELLPPELHVYEPPKSPEELEALVKSKLPADKATELLRLIAEQKAAVENRTKSQITKTIDTGGTPIQAVEKARLSAQTPQIDAAMQQLEVLRKQARELAKQGPEKVISMQKGGKPQAQYGKYVRDEDGQNFQSRGLAEAFQDADPELSDYVVVAAGKGGKGFYLAKPINKEVSLEGTHLENVLSVEDPSALESRPDVSFDDALQQIQRASQSPKVFAGESGLDLPDAILALKQAKVVLPLRKGGDLSLEGANKVLAAAKVAGFVDEAHMNETLRAIRQGIAGFQGYRNFTLDSTIPFDQPTVDAMGLQNAHAPTAIRSVLEWFVNHEQSGVMGEVVAAMLKAHGTEGLNLTFDPRDGFVYHEAERTINLSQLPTAENSFEYAAKLVHEYAHDVGLGMFERNDPAAIQFRATMTEALTAMKKSPAFPKEVRGTIGKVGEWYQQYLKDNDPFAFFQKWTDAVGEGHDDWLHAVYGLANEKELFASMFNSPHLVDVMTKTQMPAKAVTVMQYLSQIWNKIFGGRKEADNVFAQILGGLDNYLSGTRVPPKDVKVGPTLEAGQGFFYGLADYDAERNMLGGKHKLPNNGLVDEKQLKSIGGIGKPLSDGEIELYKSIVPEAFTQGKVNVPKLVQGLKEKGPVVEVRKLGIEPSETELAIQRGREAQHTLETMGFTVSQDPQDRHFYITKEGRPVPTTVGSEVHRLLEVINTPVGWENVGGRSSYSFLAPKPESEMPGYVEGLVRVPMKTFPRGRTFEDMRNDTGSIQYQGPHFGSEDTNVLSFFRGYEETLPDGSKAFHVIEVQSDWGQKLRETREARGGYRLEDLDNAATSHPLLKVYESLALKAAIAHAKEIDATKVILSDAETAMMTEGHDRALHNTELGPDFVQRPLPPPQEKGMRLHYDQTLPSAMEKLTGEKGERVEVGVHKDAREVGGRHSGEGTIVGSPVFRDAFDQPKTQITGRSYDISKVPDQQTLFEPRTPQATVRQSYNGRDFLRDSLVSKGVRPEALASRLDTVESVFKTGSLQPSIDGFTREMSAGTLPATAEAGPLKPELATALTEGTPKDVNGMGKLLLATEVPVHQELYQRMKEDVETAVSLYSNIKKGLIPGELPPNAKENLQAANVRLDALGKALGKQAIDIARFNDLDNFTPTGIEQTRVAGLTSNRLPAPPDPTEMQREAQEALGLMDARTETSRAVLERSEPSNTANWIRKTFMFTQYLKQLIPAVRPAFDHVFQLQGQTTFWKNELDAVYGMDPKNPGEMDKGRTEANFRVATNPTLMRAASDIKLWNNVEEAAGRKPSMDDPFVKATLARFNQKDRQDIITEANNAKAVHDHWTEVTAPRFLAQKNLVSVAKVIAMRERGMQPEIARDLAGQFTSAIDQLKDPQTAQMGLEMLNTLRPKMQPETYLAAFGLAKGLADDTTAHLEFMRSRPNYVTEQRIDGRHAIRMITPDNKPFFNTYGSKPEALAKVQQLEAKGYKFLEYVPAQDLNVPYRGVNEELIGKLRELDLQRQRRESDALQGLDPQLAATVLGAFNRANDYEESLAAFSPVPGAGYPKRHFVAGREELNMVQQQNMFYGRATNWMRHQLTKAETELDLLHLDLLANREATKLVRDHVSNVLSPDSQLARKMSEFTYNWKLAGNFGVNFLHLIQSLNTGMASLIAETGAVGDALALTTSAQKAVVQRAMTGKWANADHDWLDRRAASEGLSGFATWEGDIGDANRNALQFAATPSWLKPAEYLKWAARSWNGMFFKFNDRIGLLSAFDLGRSRGMDYDEAYNFARDVKNQGYFTGGKAQRAVGQWAAFGPQARAVPQLMSSLQTYVQGWFGLLASNYVKGFGRAPEGMSSTQILGAKKAFLYQLGAQAVLAGALGLPGVGQGMALVKQTTGVDVMAWLRQNLADLFGEDQKAGGMVTSLALHGATATFTPVDVSGKHMPSVPYIGVTPYKGFDIANLAGAPISTAADMVKGLMAAAKGDVQGASSLLPEVLKGPLRLWQGEGDVRDKGGNLITKLSPSERFVMAIGMVPSRVNALKDTANAVKEASQRATAEKSAGIDQIATVYRKNGIDQGHQALIQYLQQYPELDGKSIVRAVAAKVVNQTVVPDWSQRANVAADLTGLGGEATSQADRYSQRMGIEQSLGLRQRPSRQQAQLMDEVDQLRQSDPYLSVAEAEQQVRSQRRPRRSNATWNSEYR